ncbi:methylated-DNA-[protein]-cysteine S-methyltransferase [Actinacidiphila yanglinensis]|uniref:Methylated-DNA--protein-cysteine methyltransferase n=1 Tax=Actinacidiphila yanglinensis TaxID=310779 RepID=A0A1H5ZEU0_9ACTN|nr:methylated-DNA--[protein]-cysteine S-methyltransferase [Actinacidiphila yanglinensis]SEG34812.1 methylated-DNA-[protein]-cysteine S-methyltransferase [Actinacidiphila yanglinensis]
MTTTTTETVVHTLVDSPCGPLTLVAREGELSGLYMTDQRHRPPAENFGPRADLPAFDDAEEQLAAYFAGELSAFDLDLNMVGTPFQKRVWSALRDIPYGETVTYGELAEVLGRPTASRAVGLANGRNPIGVIVPCHRVVGADGSLTGYGGGLARKQWLLDLERGTQQPTLM